MFRILPSAGFNMYSLLGIYIFQHNRYPLQNQSSSPQIQKAYPVVSNYSYTKCVL